MKFIMYLLLPILFLGCSDSDEIEDINTELSKQEIEDLQFLKEEEKLARDVYLYSYDLYGQKIFKNISNSEQSHMNSVTVILNKYGIEDLSLVDRGEFSNVVLQGLYDDLTNLASKSLEDALVVGATIEDLDIKDLDNFILNTTHEDVESMYVILNCGSRNHMRAYSNNLEKIDVDYNPQFISLDDYNSIINSDNEKCNN
ncbi:MAG: DUF2202 domain-containing protein [Flavobacteriaceae bacterium]|nr:DUF2202 domain-containing protein [Flavobacteriaceae bacterium]